jgi:hypothetical protein
LTGNAQSVYFAVPEKDRSQFKRVKEAILLRYKLSPSAHRSKFHKESKKPSESFLDFASRLEQYFKLWLDPSPKLWDEKEAYAIFGKIIADQFITTVGDENLRLKLVEKSELSAPLYDLAKFADTYTLERKMIREDRDSDKHTTGDKFSDKKKTESPAASKSKYGGPKSSKPSGQRYTDSCYSCGELGHRHRDCPKATKKPSVVHPVNLVQTSCFESEWCPSAQTKLPVDIAEVNQNIIQGPKLSLSVNGEMTIALVDCGASVTIVTEDLCLKRSLKNDKTILLKWFEGSKVESSGCVLVDIICAGQLYCVECVVVKTVKSLDTPVLLGRDFIYRAGLTIDFATGSYWLAQQKPVIKWPLLDHQSVSEKYDSGVGNVDNGKP